MLIDWCRLPVMRHGLNYIKMQMRCNNQALFDATTTLLMSILVFLTSIL
jgi:hypothetical protein